MGESDRAWSAKELGARCPSTREQARADTHVQVRPRARARASPRGAGDERGGQGGGTNAVAADGVAHQAGRRRPGCSRMGDDRARCRAGQAGVCVCTETLLFFLGTVTTELYCTEGTALLRTQYNPRPCHASRSPSTSQASTPRPSRGRVPTCRKEAATFGAIDVWPTVREENAGHILVGVRRGACDSSEEASPS